MEIITKKYEVFTFDELDEEIKEKLLNKEMEYQSEAYCENLLFDDMEDTAKELLQKYFKGAMFDTMYYDLGYSQGDGAQVNFNISIFDLNKKYNFLSQKAIKSLKATGFPNFKIKHSGWYCHEKAFTIEWNYIDDFTYCDEFLTDEEAKTINEKLENIINNNFYDDIVKMNQELTKTGYTFIEDEDYFRNGALLYLQERKFLKNGDFFE